MAATSIKEVAARAGVSIGTVSNVLNRPETVTEANRLRVQAAIEELGYVRNESARQLRMGRSRFLALVVLDIANPFFTDLARGAELTADSGGHTLLLCSSAEDVARERRHLEVLRQQRVAGIVLSPVDTSAERLSELRRLDVPLVLLDRSDPDGVTASVSVDDVEGGRLAVAHLLAAGHRRIAVVGGPRGLPQVDRRTAGARRAVREAGLPADTLVEIDVPAMHLDNGRAVGATLESWGRPERPTAVFCLNDLLALGVLQEAGRRGLTVPGDLALVGYDDIEFAAAAAVPLTSVRQPTDLLGRSAVELLLQRAAAQAGTGRTVDAGTVDLREDPPAPERQVVHLPELVVRASSS
ncbi:LacI family DNA-binding transcriptional regulator [Kineococcus sp. LSe6-4]|uniref:LacI family DNA-binding transcriptional regulator n=1 Tax=Kineococcus halophytocola TaxID=3234027 RepID=A0ABV4H475_9ACTN